MLSNDADDWNELAQPVNYENTIYGVLLYPRKGIGKKTIGNEVADWVDEKYPPISNRGVNFGEIEQRGNDWAIPYRVEFWYNHFDLSEECD